VSRNSKSHPKRSRPAHDKGSRASGRLTSPTDFTPAAFPNSVCARHRHFFCESKEFGNSVRRKHFRSITTFRHENAIRVRSGDSAFSRAFQREHPAEQGFSTKPPGSRWSAILRLVARVRGPLLKGPSSQCCWDATGLDPVCQWNGQELENQTDPHAARRSVYTTQRASAGPARNRERWHCAAVGPS
jgi:hypothetical protein